MPETAAIVIAPNGTGGALGVLVERLAGAGMRVAVVDDLPSAADHPLRGPATCVLLDLREVGGDPEDLKRAGERIRRVIATLPGTTPVCITAVGDPSLVIACVRAGAADVIDLKLEGTAGARVVVQRVAREQARTAESLGAHREVIEELMKALIRTERRTIDLEEQLAGGADARTPAVLLVEHERPVADILTERLAASGISTFAFSTGAEAVREADALLASGSGIDLALVAAQLPGIDGLETVNRLRERIPDLPAFLITDDDDDDLADQATDAGVIGFVMKPLDDMDHVVARLAHFARESLSRSRESVYLARIKQRHERVLARYQSLPRD